MKERSGEERREGPLGTHCLCVGSVSLPRALSLFHHLCVRVCARVCASAAPCSIQSRHPEPSLSLPLPPAFSILALSPSLPSVLRRGCACLTHSTARIAHRATACSHALLSASGSAPLVSPQPHRSLTAFELSLSTSQVQAPHPALSPPPPSLPPLSRRDEAAAPAAVFVRSDRWSLDALGDLGARFLLSPSPPATAGATATTSTAATTTAATTTAATTAAAAAAAATSRAQRLPPSQQAGQQQQPPLRPQPARPPQPKPAPEPGPEPAAPPADVPSQLGDGEAQPNEPRGRAGHAALRREAVDADLAAFLGATGDADGLDAPGTAADGPASGRPSDSLFDLYLPAASVALADPLRPGATLAPAPPAVPAPSLARASAHAPPPAASALQQSLRASKGDGAPSTGTRHGRHEAAAPSFTPSTAAASAAPWAPPPGPRAQPAAIRIDLRASSAHGRPPPTAPAEEGPGSAPAAIQPSERAARALSLRLGQGHRAAPADGRAEEDEEDEEDDEDDTFGRARASMRPRPLPPAAEAAIRTPQPQPAQQHPTRPPARPKPTSPTEMTSLVGQGPASPTRRMSRKDVVATLSCSAVGPPPPPAACSSRQPSPLVSLFPWYPTTCQVSGQP